MSNKSKKKTFKLITGILIPILIMVSSIVMVGVSYAWFSASQATTVSQITMSTEEAFTLAFDFDGNPQRKYEGQLAYVTKNNVTHLVTDDYATTSVANGGLGYTNPSTIYDGYMQDAPYAVGADIILDTQGKTVEFEVYINYINIYMETTENNVTTKTTLMSLSNLADINLIPYGFTWYISNSANNIIYTPYGTSSGNSLPVSGERVTQKWSSTPQLQSITGFSSTVTYENNQPVPNMKIYVVFCPEKLYWMQYSNGTTYNNSADWKAGLDDIYSAAEKNMIYHLDSYGNTSGNYNPTSNPDLSGYTYWDPKYVGAKFELNFTVNVKHVDKN